MQDFSLARRAMVDNQLRPQGVTDRGVLAAAPLTEPPLRRTIAMALPSQRRISKAAHFVADELRRQIEMCVRRGKWPGAHLTDTKRGGTARSTRPRA